MAVVLSEGWKEILNEAGSLGFEVINTYPISLKGLVPTIFVLKKANSFDHETRSL